MTTPTARLRARRKAQRAEDAVKRELTARCTEVAECVYSLDGGDNYGQTFLREFYPHESDFIPPEMQLSRARVDSALRFLTVLAESIGERERLHAAAEAEWAAKWTASV